MQSFALILEITFGTTSFRHISSVGGYRSIDNKLVNSSMMFAWWTLLCVILCIISVSSGLSASKDYKIRILQPTNNSLVSASLAMKLQIIRQDFYGIDNLNDGLKLIIAFNGTMIHSSAINASIFYGHLDTGILTIGRTEIAFYLTEDNNQEYSTVLAHESISIYHYKPEGDNFKKFLSRVSGRQSSFAFIGLQQSSLRYFTSLNIFQLDLFYPLNGIDHLFQYPSNDDSLISFPNYRLHSNPQVSQDRLKSLPYIDNCIIYYQPREDLIEFILLAAKKVKNGLYVLVDEKDIPSFDTLQDRWQRWFQSSIPQLEPILFFRDYGLSLVVSTNTVLPHTKLFGIEMKQFPNFDYFSQFQSASEGNMAVNTHELIPSSIISSSFVPGRAFIHISKACIVRTAGVAEGIHSNHRVLLFRNSSDPIINIDHLASHEEYGFLYTGIDIQETDLLHETSVLAYRTWPWRKGLTALSTSVAGSHLSHELEPLLQLLHATVKSNQLQHSFDSAYLRIMSFLTSVVLGKVTVENINDWMYRMLGFLLGFIETHSGRSLSATLIDRLLSTDANPFSEEFGGLPHAVCFDELVLLGRTDSELIFLGDQQLAMMFKRYIYQAMNASSAVDYGVPILRQYKAKIFIVIRSSSSHRKMMNLDAIREQILSLDYIDKEWFLRYGTVMMEALTFEEQFHLFSEADIAICVHGAAITNGIFMRAGSVVIDIFNGHYIEYYFNTILQDFGVGYVALPITNHTQQTKNCPVELQSKPHCYQGTLREGNSLNCLENRQCSLFVDLMALQSALLEGYLKVLSQKIAKNRFNGNDTI